MKELVDKLSSYNIFNYLFPGTLFAYLGTKFTSYMIVQDNLVVGLFLYYFIGLIISRIGSLTVEPFLKWIRVVKFADYEDYVQASKSDSKIELFSELNNMYRTLCSLPIMLGVLKIYDGLLRNRIPGGDHTNDVFLLIGFLTLFLLSYRKQTKYVVKRVKIALEKKEG